jgi:nanoRNase/pAp phosphatase (c-di-AMP/oligoRNAs hydrolase)
VGWGIPSRLVYCGLVARAENREMLRLLASEWEHVVRLPRSKKYSALALVDTQPGAGNNQLPVSAEVQIVIDHHLPVQDRTRKAAFWDVRPEAGATVSLVYQYLEAAGVVPDVTLATAMFYGIETDTHGLSRDSSPIDQRAYSRLWPSIDPQILAQVEQAGLPREYFRAINRGLQAARIYGKVVIAYLKRVPRPDFAGELADLLIRLHGAHAVLCLGYYGKSMYLSLRTIPTSIDAGVLIQDIVTPLGQAGGHGTSAGGRVPLAGSKPEVVADELERRFLSLMGESSTGKSLLLG